MTKLFVYDEPLLKLREEY